MQNSGQAVINFDNLSDNVDVLPTDQNVPTHSEIQIVDSLFKKQHGTVQKLLFGTKDVLIVGFIFLVVNLPQFDDLVKKFFPISENSPYVLVGIKALLFMFIYFIVKNMYLVRKKS